MATSWPLTAMVAPGLIERNACAIPIASLKRYGLAAGQRRAVVGGDARLHVLRGLGR